MESAIYHTCTELKTPAILLASTSNSMESAIPDIKAPGTQNGDVFRSDDEDYKSQSESSAPPNGHQKIERQSSRPEPSVHAHAADGGPTVGRRHVLLHQVVGLHLRYWQYASLRPRLLRRFGPLAAEVASLHRRWRSLLATARVWGLPRSQNLRLRRGRDRRLEGVDVRQGRQHHRRDLLARPMGHSGNFRRFNC